MKKQRDLNHKVMLGRKSGPMKDRRQPKGGAKKERYEQEEQEEYWIMVDCGDGEGAQLWRKESDYDAALLKYKLSVQQYADKGWKFWLLKCMGEI